VSAGARPAPGGDGHAAGPEPEPGGVVHSLWRNRPLRLPAGGDARAVHRGHRSARGTGRRAVGAAATRRVTSAAVRRRHAPCPPGPAQGPGRRVPTGTRRGAPSPRPSPSPRGGSLRTRVVSRSRHVNTDWHASVRFVMVAGFAARRARMHARRTAQRPAAHRRPVVHPCTGAGHGPAPGRGARDAGRRGLPRRAGRGTPGAYTASYASPSYVVTVVPP